MKTSPIGVKLIKMHESLRLESYLCPANIWTIGYGHTNQVLPNSTISEVKANNLLNEDLAIAEAAVRKYVVIRGLPLAQHQFDALVSLVFNLGSHTIFSREYKNGYFSGSTLYNKLLVLDYLGAADRFTDFVKAGGRILRGLEERRNFEKKLFLNQIH